MYTYSVQTVYMYMYKYCDADRLVAGDHLAHARTPRTATEARQPAPARTRHPQRPPRAAHLRLTHLPLRQRHQPRPASRRTFDSARDVSCTCDE